MKKLNLFLIALTCAALCFVGCKNPSSSGSSGTPLDLTQELGDWIVGTWDLKTENTMEMGKYKDGPDIVKIAEIEFKGNKDTDECIENVTENKMGFAEKTTMTVKEYKESISESVFKEQADAMLATLEYKLTVNSSNDVITCTVKFVADGYTDIYVTTLTKRK